MAPSFADIFRGNCISSGLVPAQVTEDGVAPAVRRAGGGPEAAEVVVDVAARTVSIPSAGITEPFELADFAQWRLLEGLDDVGADAAARGGHLGLRGQPGRLAAHAGGERARHRLKCAIVLQTRDGRRCPHG